MYGPHAPSSPTAEEKRAQAHVQNGDQLTPLGPRPFALT